MAADVDEQPTCPTCGQRMPAERPATDATPAPLFTVDLTAKLGGRWIHYPTADLGDYVGDIVVPVTPVYSARVPKASVFTTKSGPAENYLSHNELFEMCRLGIQQPTPVAVLTMATKRVRKQSEKPVAAPTPPTEGEPA